MRLPVVLLTALALAAASTAQAADVPVIKKLSFRYGTSQDVKVSMRVCGGAEGRSRVSFVEAKSLDGKIFASNVRVRRFKQTGRCTRVRFSWPLMQKFIGVGRYKLTATVFDSDGLKSADKSTSKLTTD